MCSGKAAFGGAARGQQRYFHPQYPPYPQVNLRILRLARLGDDDSMMTVGRWAKVGKLTGVQRLRSRKIVGAARKPRYFLGRMLILRRGISGGCASAVGKEWRRELASNTFTASKECVGEASGAARYEHPKGSDGAEQSKLQTRNRWRWSQPVAHAAETRRRKGDRK